LAQRQGSSRLRPIVLRAALTLFTIVLSLPLAELAFRLLTREGQFYGTSEVEFWKAQLRQERARGGGAAGNIQYDPVLGWRMKPNYRADGPSGLVTQNSRGFRGPAEFAAGPGPRTRVLVLGASMAYGLGVSDDEVFTARLATDYGVEAINAGVNAFGADQALLMWEEEGRALAPALVLLVYHVDDFYRVGLPIRDLPKPYFVESEGSVRLAGVPVPTVEELASRGALDPPRALRVALAYHWLVVRARWRLGRPDATEMSRLERLNTYVLERLRDSTRASGARLLVLIAGHCSPGAPYEYSRSRELEIVRSLGIESMDYAEALDGDRATYYGANCHWSPLAHARIAADLAERLGLQAAPKDGKP
jgi:hypothetical protein